jgi:hypothetical protein
VVPHVTHHGPNLRPSTTTVPGISVRLRMRVTPECPLIQIGPTRSKGALTASSKTVIHQRISGFRAILQLPMQEALRQRETRLELATSSLEATRAYSKSGCSRRRFGSSS